jgi:hypothetical protein
LDGGADLCSKDLGTPSNELFLEGAQVMHHRYLLAAAALIVAGSAFAADLPYSVKEAKTPPPEGLKEEIAKALGERSYQFVDEKGNLLCELWFRKEVPAKATPEQVKNGLTYRELPEGSLLGVVSFAKGASDYKKQKIKAGVYTLRLGFQPENGDHMGTAPYNEFCLLTPAADDKALAPLSAKDLQESSTKASGTAHPSVLLLFPISAKEAGAGAKVVDKGDGHFVLTLKLELKVGDQKVDFGIGLTLIGVSAGA